MTDMRSASVKVAASPVVPQASTARTPRSARSAASAAVAASSALPSSAKIVTRATPTPLNTFIKGFRLACPGPGCRAAKVAPTVLRYSFVPFFRFLPGRGAGQLPCAGQLLPVPALLPSPWLTAPCC